VIPTRRKSKIPKTLSYPIGAKAITAALAGVPQEELLGIEFWFWKFSLWNRRGHQYEAGSQHRVITVSYSGQSRYFDPRWTIEVEAVPRSLKHEIQGKILDEVLPKVKEWLTANAHSLDREGYHALTFSFDELKNEITVSERTSTEWETERIR
jgi:hypothetical protein